MTESPAEQQTSEEAAPQPHPWADLAPERLELLRLSPLPIDRHTGVRSLRFVELGRVERHSRELMNLRYEALFLSFAAEASRPQAAPTGVRTRSRSCGSGLWPRCQSALPSGPRPLPVPPLPRPGVRDDGVEVGVPRLPA